MEAHPETKRPLYEVPHTKGVIGSAANFVYHIADSTPPGSGRLTTWKKFPHRHGRRLHHGESRGDRRGYRPDPLADYQRHDTKQPEKVLEFLKRFETEIEGFAADRSRMFITGSGGNGMAKSLGAKFVQEVNAVSLAVERMYPECGSVIELGGQDAKIIIFKNGPGNRPQEEDPVDERQVRRRYRRGHR